MNSTKNVRERWTWAGTAGGAAVEAVSSSHNRGAVATIGEQQLKRMQMGSNSLSGSMQSGSSS